MIAYLKGKIQDKSKDGAIVVVNDIGYQFSLPHPLLEKIKIGEEREFFTHEYLREDSRELYGFEKRDEIRLFLDLLKVSGVGPRMALNVMSLGSIKVKEAITRGDVAILTSISGVGTKTAQKIILELKGILAEATINLVDVEAMDALRQLGYSQREASEALRGLEGAETTEEKIKGALKILGKR